MISKYSKEQIDFIRKHAPTCNRSQLTEKFNQEFDMQLTDKTMKSTMSNHKIKIGIRETKNMVRLLTREQETFVQENYVGISTVQLAEMLNSQFNLSITPQQLKSYKCNRGLQSGISTCFEKGHVPLNKGTKGMFNVGGNKTSFKKGQTPKNIKPVGYESLRSDGYIWVKIAEPNKWKEKHRLVWEKEHGPIPRDHVIIFKDSDGTNCELENLKMITRAQHAMLNKNNWRFKDKDLMETSILLADLELKKTKVKKDAREN